ncbi:MAG: hypothetical protein JSV65_12180 [Armatimonadota bacterium]|nr:MAG: hypothetical protein JSV65_12180 [Armatimonadota bacterium]
MRGNSALRDRLGSLASKARHHGDPARPRPCRADLALRLLVLITGLGLAGTSGTRAAALDLESLLPRSGAVEGWRTQGKPASYTPTTLFDYINGGADFYLAYDFQRVAVGSYVGPGGAKITVELYDMGSSHDAFGVFSHERARESPPVGQESSYSGGLLTFWKDRLFARIFTDRESETARDAILKLGKAVSTAVRAMGKKPPMLGLLPRPGLAAASVRYLHTDTSLNSVLYLPGNALRLNRRTNVVYGEYPQADGPPAKLAIVIYPEARHAMAGYLGAAKLHGASGDGNPPPWYVSESDRFRWVGAFVRNRYVVLASHAPDEGVARALLESARKRIGKG